MTTNNSQQQRPAQNTIRINGQIRTSSATVQVIDQDGKNLGEMLIYKAIQLSKEAGLDLIEINPKAFPAICRIGDFGKIQYESKKQQQEQKKKQKNLDQKEIDFRPATADGDMGHKLNKVQEFLTEGHRVKLVCKFRGREMSFRDLGQAKMNWMIEQLVDLIGSNTPIGLEGRDMITILSPKSQGQSQASKA